MCSPSFRQFIGGASREANRANKLVKTNITVDFDKRHVIVPNFLPLGAVAVAVIVTTAGVDWPMGENEVVVDWRFPVRMQNDFRDAQSHFAAFFRGVGRQESSAEDHFHSTLMKD